jgi:predicted secreted hydrolase
MKRATIRAKHWGIGLLAIVSVIAMSIPAEEAPTEAATSGTARVHLPRDDAMHPWADSEWWYVVGHLRDARGHRYGYEAVAFRFAHLKRLLPYDSLDTVYRADTAVTDEDHRSFLGTQHFFKPDPAQTTVSSATLQLHVGPVIMARLKVTPQPVYRVQETAPDGTRLDLTLRALKPPLLVGGTGQVPMGTGSSSYYYSLTRLETSGVLIQPDGTHPVQVSGISWMDHQWGSWDQKGVAGWDWMALQLENGIDLNVYQLRASNGTVARVASISLQDGRQTVVYDATMQPTGHWRSPLSHIIYPAGWHVVIRELGLDIRVRPTVAGQEIIDRFFPEGSYWEGSCTIMGTIWGHTIKGLAYYELVGYGSATGVGALSSGTEQ